jgi:hypothetical protein
VLGLAGLLVLDFLANKVFLLRRVLVPVLFALISRAAAISEYTASDLTLSFPPLFDFHMD